jgi:hypothetical protein
MLNPIQPADAAIHALAMRLARRCRRIVQACLREEEWADADREFYLTIREELEAMGDDGQRICQTRRARPGPGAPADR